MLYLLKSGRFESFFYALISGSIVEDGGKNMPPSISVRNIDAPQP